MKILVTGANGYLGQGIVKAILDNGHEVIAADFSVDHVDDRAKKVAGNMFEFENPYEYFRRPEILLHLAWRDGFVHYSNAHIDDLPNHFAFIQKMADHFKMSIPVKILKIKIPLRRAQITGIRRSGSAAFLHELGQV